LAASAPSLPAATTWTTPVATELQIASRNALASQLVPAEPGPLRLMFATVIGLALVMLAVTWSMPQITDSQLPEPVSPRTFTGTTAAWVAAPTNVLPVTRADAVPATWVPWPCTSSVEVEPASTQTTETGYACLRLAGRGSGPWTSDLESVTPDEPVPVSAPLRDAVERFGREARTWLPYATDPRVRHACGAASTRGEASCAASGTQTESSSCVMPTLFDAWLSAGWG
jgi:hypothetical protein